MKKFPRLVELYCSIWLLIVNGLKKYSSRLGMMEVALDYVHKNIYLLVHYWRGSSAKYQSYKFYSSLCHYLRMVKHAILAAIIVTSLFHTYNCIILSDRILPLFAKGGCHQISSWFCSSKLTRVVKTLKS